MAFIDQVQDLTSLSASDTDELSQFLKDGVIDVTNRWLAIRPQDIELFGRETSEQTSNGSLNLNGARIISVIREDGVTSNNWRACRKISSSQQYLVTDEESLSFASKFNPAYMIGDAGKISVFPTPGADPNAFKAYYVNKDPVNSSGSALIHSHDDILYFPIDKVYLVVLYASMRSVQAKMGDTTITDLTVTAVPPDVPVLASTSISFSQAAPTYSKPTLTTRVSFEDFFNTVEDGNPFGDSDPSTLTISVSAPTTPSDPSISSPTVGAITIAALPTAPVYTPPAITTAGSDSTTLDLTKLDTVAWTALDYDFDDENIDPLKWFQVAGDLIQNQEDSELAQAQLQKISTYIQAYGVAMQSRLNTFNDQNVDFQAGIQRNLQQAQIDMQDAHKEADLTLQAALQDYTLELQLFQAEVAKYQAQVGDEVQEYNTKLQRYTTELTTAFQAWGKTETDSLQQYTADIQQELNEFNKENAEYQVQLQVSIQNAQLENQDEQFKVQKYQAEYAGYAAEVTEQVQAYTQNLQADGIGYQWLQDQYNRLKAEYDAAFMIAAPKQQQAAPAR
jgi:hypothetical protein